MRAMWHMSAVIIMLSLPVRTTGVSWFNQDKQYVDVWDNYEKQVFQIVLYTYIKYGRF